jgi:hypothetical protein
MVTKWECALSALQIKRFSIFGNPLPFYHLCGIAGTVEGFLGSIKAILNSAKIDSITLFSFAVGIAVYLSVMIANKKFINPSFYRRDVALSVKNTVQSILE